MKTVFLFPGQGAQKEGMLKTMDQSDPMVKEIFAETQSILGQPATELDTADKLTSTAYVQVCLLITGVISARRLQDKGVKADFVAGHSIGAFAAAVISGSLTFGQALPLVYTRGLLMQQVYPQGYGMAALVGLSEIRIKQFIAEHNKTHDNIYLANINSADQMVIAGKLESIQQFIDTYSTNLRKAKILNMTVPSHCELLQGVSDVLKEKLAVIDLKEPVIAYMSDHNGRLIRTAQGISEDLWKSVATTVRWYDGNSLLYELGVRIFIEMEPSGVLSKITESSFPEANVLALQENHLESVTSLWKTFQAAHIS